MRRWDCTGCFVRRDTRRTARGQIERPFASATLSSSKETRSLANRELPSTNGSRAPGALGAGGAAVIDTRPAYIAFLLLDAASFVLALGGEKQEQSYRAVARNRPYVTLVSMSAFSS